MQWIKVSEFCKQEGVSHQGVYKKIDSVKYIYIKRDHVKMSSDKHMLLDEIAVEALRPKNKTAKPKSEDLENIRDQLSGCEEKIRSIEEIIRSVSDDLNSFRNTFTKQQQNFIADTRKHMIDHENRLAALEEQVK